MNKQDKRFDNWDNVDCNDCSNYWNDSCDGVSEGFRKPCNSFLAQRSVTIPAEINSLRKAIERLRTTGIITSAILVLHLTGHLFNWW